LISGVHRRYAQHQGIDRQRDFAAGRPDGCWTITGSSQFDIDAALEELVATAADIFVVRWSFVLEKLDGIK
jgi:hypothetical protein